MADNEVFRMTYYRAKGSRNASCQLARRVMEEGNSLMFSDHKDDLHALFDEVCVEMTGESLQKMIEEGTVFLVLTATRHSDYYLWCRKGFLPVLVRRKDFYALRRMMSN